MHRTLKEAVPPAATLQAQQQRFNGFVSEYNAERSHEALERRTPRELYTASPRSYSAKLPPVAYGTEVTVRRVRHNGEIKWKGHLIYVSDILAKEPIGMHQIDELLWEVRYSFHLLGVLDERNQKINPPSQWHG
ncbi:MAG: transposase [Gammaproteobacteria bacterium]